MAPALAAAVDAELAYALPEAQRYYDWLLETLDEGIDGPATDLPVTRAELVDRAADVASRAGDLDRAAQLIADALAGIDPRREPARAAILHERRGWCLLQRGRDDDALEAYEQAIRLVPTEPPTAARARVLAASADALERIDRPAQAAARAAEAVAAAVIAHSPADEGHARHTLGVTLGGDRRPHRRPRRAAPLARARRPGGDVADAAGIHRHLWRLLVAEGRAGELVETTIADAAGAATGMPVLAGVFDAIAAGYCHQLGRWAEAEAMLDHLDPGRLDGIVQLVVAALVDVDRGAVARAGDRLETVRAGTFGLRDGRIDGLLFRGLAEREWARGQASAVAEIVEEGLQRTTDPEMSGWLALVGLRAVEEGAGRDRRVAVEVAPARRARRTTAPRRSRRAALGSAHRRGRARPAARPQRGAALGRRRRRVAADGFPASRRLLPVAPCRGGAGGRGQPRASRRPVRRRRLARRRARGVAARGSDRAVGAAGALPSVGGARDEPATRGGDGDFGITARELEVLELLARGWTNRQIAEALFISEKTARVARLAPAQQARRAHPRRRRRRRPPPRPARPPSLNRPYLGGIRAVPRSRRDSAPNPAHNTPGSGYRT